MSMASIRRCPRPLARPLLSSPRAPSSARPRIAPRPLLRPLSCASAMLRPLTFSSGEDVARLADETAALVDAAQWRVDGDGIGVEKTFYFSNYTKCLDFAMAVGIRSKSKKHHSKMTIEYGSVHIRWTTHRPRGLSSQDTFMARYCDEQAQTIGTVAQPASAGCGRPS